MFEKDVDMIRGTLAQKTFIHHLYAGATKDEACGQMGINPGAVAFVRRENKEFNQAIRDAEASRIDNKVDELLNIHDTHSDPLMARVISDNIKWTASKRLREIYGDKVDHVVEHKISLVQAIQDARARTTQFIDAKCVEVLDNVTDIKSVAPIVDAVKIEKDDPFA